MECCILRGSKEIGGSCVELSFEGERIILDIGLPLDSKKDPKEELPNIKGILKKTDDLKGIIVSHYHQDHCGLLPFVDKNIPIAIGHIAREIINTSAFFMKKDYRIETYVPLENKKSFYLGKFKITPYLVDHSAYDAYALLIEAGDKKLFYTGDLRAHGRKALLSRCFVFKMKTNLDDLQYIQKNTLYFTENKKWIKEIKIPDNRTSSSFLELYVSQNINQSNFCFEKIEDIANKTKLPVFYIAITAAKMMKHKFASMFEKSIRATQNNKKITRLKIYLFANLLRIEEKNNE